ncbi:TPA: DEAD/DEAH box helicase [Listeria monocytogenes]|nr:DEAD/DEAH box helicase [Listeria monocytogenes]EIU5761790.1 DEAD/DEAH box helicase [Listeria monocytogenes]HBB5502526.1 DEAD/DEAH box helicase [Listeria monocytogenes]HBL4844551.1 DEAD/DEAH box helicase [Listeria monocytogenes]HBL5612930.1 DEAD/DEAH box helicase [Listeria monocytogenes]
MRCCSLWLGAGKSVILSEIIRMTTRNKNNVLFLVHRKELIDQIRNTLTMNDVDMKFVNLGMVQTVVRRLEKTSEPALIIIDESHHVLANSYKKIINHFSKAKVVGFTATPVRINGGGLGDINDTLIEKVNVKWLIENQFLAHYKYYAPEIVQTETLNVKRTGEFDMTSLDDQFNKRMIWGDVIKHYQKLANGEQAILYASSIYQSEKMAASFNAVGISSAHIDGKTPKLIRDDIIKRFREGEIKVLCNLDLIGEGFDVPDCSTVIMLRPTQSLSLYIQQSMRGMRYKHNKTAIIIDHVGNVKRFGLPDMERTWSLAPRKGSNATKAEAPVKICPDCFMTVLSSNKQCEHCGHEFKVEAKPIQIDDAAELQEITEPIFQVDYSSPNDCKNMKELYEYAKQHNYKRGWAYHQGKVRGFIK